MIVRVCIVGTVVAQAMLASKQGVTKDAADTSGAQPRHYRASSASVASTEELVLSAKDKAKAVKSKKLSVEAAKQAVAFQKVPGYPKNHEKYSPDGPHPSERVDPVFYVRFPCSNRSHMSVVHNMVDHWHEQVPSCRGASL